MNNPIGKYVRDDIGLKKACGFTPGCQICFWNESTQDWGMATADENGEAMLPGCYCHFEREPIKPAMFSKVWLCCCSCACGEGQGGKPKTEEPCIQVMKSCDDTTAMNAGETVTFTITLTNCGPLDFSSVVVTDPLTGMNETVALAAGESMELTTDYEITADDQAAGTDLVNEVSVVATYMDMDGNEGTLEAGDSHAVPMAECAAELAGTPCETGASEATTTTLQAFPDDVRTTELSRGQAGDGVFANGDSGLWDVLVNDNQVPIDIPAHTAGCKLWLHVTGGQILKTGLPTAILPGTSDLAFVPVSQMSAPGDPATGNGNSDIFQTIYCASGTGNAGQVLVELADINADNRGDHIAWVVSETCSDTRALKPQDMNVGALIELEGAPQSEAPKENNPGAEFTVDCPALIFGAGRHVLHPETDPDASLVDGQWFNVNGNAGAEVYDIVSHDSWQCQSGLAMDFMNAAGTYSWDWSHNSTTGINSGWDVQAFAVVIPFTCEGCWLADPISSEECSPTLVNNLCSGEEASVKCVSEAIVEVDLSDGAELTLTPVIDGVADASLSQTLVGPLSGPQTMQVEGPAQDIALGEEASCTFSATLELSGGDGESTASFTSTSTAIVPA